VFRHSILVVLHSDSAASPSAGRDSSPPPPSIRVGNDFEDHADPSPSPQSLAKRSDRSPVPVSISCSNIPKKKGKLNFSGPRARGIMQAEWPLILAQPARARPKIAMDGRSGRADRMAPGHTSSRRHMQFNDLAKRGFHLLRPEAQRAQ